MFDKRLVWTGISLAAILTTSYVAARLPAAPETSPIQETISDVQKEPPEAEPPSSAYLLREYGGRIGVFRGGESDPEMILDVLVKYLPEYDRAQLQSGIPADSYEQLVAMIEDYSS